MDGGGGCRMAAGWAERCRENTHVSLSVNDLCVCVCT